MAQKTDISSPEKNKADNRSRTSAGGWKELVIRIKDNLAEDHVSIVAAGIAYYLFVALFPTIIAALSIYGLVMDPAQAEQQMNQLAAVLPEQASQMVGEILQRSAEQTGQSLGWGLAISILFSLWFAHQGTAAVFEGVNIAYREHDERGFIKQKAIVLLFTLGAIILGIICTALVVVFPALVKSIQLPIILETLIQWLRWPLMAFLVIGALGLTYKVAPDRSDPGFRWISPGAVAATVLWLAGSILFSLYIDNFGNYDEMYGSFAAVIILMLWFFITAYIILLGAEINAELERQSKTGQAD